jgi:hypothetical protein
MSTDWSEVAADVLATILENGRLCRLVLPSTNVADTDKPWNVTEGTPTYYPSSAGTLFAVADVPMPTGSGKLAEGYPDKNCIIPGNVGVDVDMHMLVELLDGEGAGVYSIKTMNTYAPDGVTRIGWKVRLSSWRET